jgi:hypothetical protein
VGDDLTIFDGWTASLHIENNDQRWTPEALQRALIDVAPQQRGMTQALKGRAENSTPQDTVLETLAALERGRAD